MGIWHDVETKTQFSQWVGTKIAEIEKDTAVQVEREVMFF
jgi:hypothetical protein